MTPSEIGAALDAAEESLARGGTLAGTRFWRAVAAVKAEPGLVDRFAQRIARIDATAFRRWALLVVPLWIGTLTMVLATVLGLLLVALAYGVEGVTAIVLFFVGFGVLLVATHGLAHLVVGRLAGIRFTHWFIGTITRPQPGVKVDYASYLATPARARAWMHAAGALTTKVIPFALIGAAVAADLPGWTVWVLVAVGVISVITDVVWSTKSSDWKKFRRERSFAQTS
ncbi:MAG TPA: hypothetical protein EYP73_06960 [Acidimicrobiia bacterium]|nr:hypothetical protein [Acidimicrobiia bacterium]